MDLIYLYALVKALSSFESLGPLSRRNCCNGTTATQLTMIYETCRGVLFGSTKESTFKKCKGKIWSFLNSVDIERLIFVRGNIQLLWWKLIKFKKPDNMSHVFVMQFSIWLFKDNKLQGNTVTSCRCWLVRLSKLTFDIDM